MANIFKPKRSNTSSAVPTTGDLADGELAVNSADKIIYLRDGGSVVEVANYSTATGTGTSYWVQTDVGIHTLSNVGIGTTNPTSKLTVNGDANIIGIVTATSYYGDGSNLSGISTDSLRLLGNKSSFYLDYENFINIPQEDWTETNLGIIGSGTTITGISTSYTFSSSRTVAGVSTDKLTVRGHLYYPTSSHVGPEVDVVVLYHGTIETPGVSPLDAAQTFIDIATNTSQLNIRDKIVFSVAYPQDAVPVWVNNVESPSLEFPEFGTFLTYSDFYFGDNLSHAEAALLWVKEKLNSYLTSIGVGKSISRVYTFGHSQGGLLVHILNTLHQVDGVISNAPGPIDLLTRCSTSEANNNDNYTCNKIRLGVGSTTASPEAYNSVSLKSYLSGTLSPALFTQALDDLTGNSVGVPQVENMQNVVQVGLETCVNCSPTTFNYYDTGGHSSFVTNTIQQQDIRDYINSGTSALYAFKNVGIGTTNPTSKLTVNGDVNITGVVTATSYSGSGTNLTGIVTSISAGTGISVNQSTGNVTITSTTTEHKILDDISSSFNGSTTQFTISSSSTNFLNSEITTAARLLISVGGVVQQPDPTQTNGFYISGGTNISTDPIKINFVEAPKAGQVFFGVAYGLTASPSSSFVTAEQSIAYSIAFGV